VAWTDAGDALGALLAFRSLPRLGRWSLLAATCGTVSVAAVLASYVD
jgi:hypothetical protein